jgi:hypothetical protein
MTSVVSAGFTLSKVSPLDESHHTPPMKFLKTLIELELRDES